MSKLLVNEIEPLTGTAGIGIGAPTSTPSAIFAVTSTTQGILIPRMTTVQRDAIVSPVRGLAIYNTDSNALETFNGTSWFSSETDELAVSLVSGLMVSFTQGKVLINGTIYSIAAGSLTVGNSITNGTIYVDVDGVIKASSSTTFAGNVVPLAIFTSNLVAVTLLTDARTFVNANSIFGTVGDITTIQPDDAASAGSANRNARADHRHAIAADVAVTQTPDQSNAEGTSASFARADHGHNIPTASAVGLDTTSTSTQGSNASFARSNHTHAIASGAPSTQTPDQANAAGSSSNFAKADHVHNVPTATAIGLDANSTSTQGAASTFARSNHTHAIASGAPSTQNVDQANAAGSSANFAKADHIHNIPTAAPTDIGSANAQGSATTTVKSDHVHKGVHSIKANSGTQRFGDTSINSGVGTTVSDDGSGNFTVETNLGANEFYVSQGAGLTANYTAGRVRINGTTYNLTASSITVATGATNGRIYVDVDGVVKSTTATTTPANAVPLAIFSSSGAAITALSDNRTLLNQSITFGASGDIVAIAPNNSAAAGATNKHADAGHTHTLPTGTPVDTSTSNAAGTANTVARSDHTHNTVITNGFIDSVASATTSSATDAVINSMTLTPAAGTYIVSFEGVFSHGTNNGVTNYSIYAGAVQQANSVRSYTTQNNTKFAVTTSAKVTVDGATAITAQWNTPAGTATILGRSLRVVRTGT